MYRTFAVIGLMALVLAPAAWADHGPQDPTTPPPAGDVLSAERICQVEVNVPVVFRVGECVEANGFSQIPVEVNTRTRVSIESSDFVRFERDCDGNLLSTSDKIEAALAISFVEASHCAADAGGALEVKLLSDKVWCVNPHNGGYVIRLNATPSAFDICDDAGCYQANLRILVVAEPFEDCRAVPPAPEPTPTPTPTPTPNPNPNPGQ